MLLITSSVPQGNRSSLHWTVCDTFIGTLVALSINFVIRPPEEEKKDEIQEDLVVLRQKELELKAMLEEVQGEISEQEKQENKNSLFPECF